MARKRKNVHVGSSFESYLAEQGDLEVATALAVKRVLAWELARAMKTANISRAELARRMRTSRAVVHRLLDESDPSVTLATISRAATALGRSVRVRIGAA
jgi:plasmid maintenance system antidote protein VapI